MVNAIAPALVETEMVTSNPNAKPDLIPVGRFGSVEEAADVAVMLARNGYITGQTINVNGAVGYLAVLAAFWLTLQFIGPYPWWLSAMVRLAG